MLQLLPKINLPSILLISGSFLLLAALAIQYPLSVTFPMGGDAPAYVKTAQAVLGGNYLALIKNTVYPLADLTFLPFALIPISWPMRFVWWAAACQIIVGLTLAWVLKRHFGWITAAAGMAFWSFMAISASRHFEDGTIAQLLSFAPLFLLVGSILAGKIWHGLLWFIVASLTHPITGVALAIVLVPTTLGWFIAWPLLAPPLRRSLHIMLIIIIPLFPVIFAIFSRFKLFISYLKTTADSSSIFSLTESHFWAIFLLTIVGFFLLLQAKQKHPHQIIFLVTITISFLLLAHNNWLGFGIWIKRLYPYIIAWSIFLAAYAWPILLRQLTKSRTVRLAIGSLLPLIIFSVAWNNNARVYHFYESPSRYLRLHPDELAAFDWINDNIQSPATIYSSTANRHTEWLPVLTSTDWIQVRDEQVTALNTIEDLPLAPSDTATYVLFFSNREEIPSFVKSDTSQYPIVFKNDGATLISIKKQ